VKWKPRNGISVEEDLLFRDSIPPFIQLAERDCFHLLHQQGTEFYLELGGDGEEERGYELCPIC
jgi:hypothetical protein